MTDPWEGWFKPFRREEFAEHLKAGRGLCSFPGCEEPAIVVFEPVRLHGACPYRRALCEVHAVEQLDLWTYNGRTVRDGIAHIDRAMAAV